MVIISPRRYGKTSLVINALERNHVPFLYIDCALAEDERSLVNAIANEYASKLDNIQVLEKVLRKFNITFSININPISVSVSQVKIDSLKSILTEAAKHYVIVFDEFQDIYEKNKHLVNKIRSIIQFLENSVVMLGSKRHLLTALFLKPRGILYNFGSAMHLDKIEHNIFKKFIMNWFKKTKVLVRESEIEEVLNFTGNHPFFTQYLCHFLFEKRINEKATISQVIEDIMNVNSAFYEETYLPLSPTQKKAALLLSSQQDGIYSLDLLAKFQIKSTQALQKAIKALMKKEIVDKNGSYYIIDVFFKHWLYQKVLGTNAPMRL